MIVIVEDGTGLPNANAYASVVEVTDILSTNIYSTWATQTDGVKANLVLWASRILDERVRWYGKKTFKTSGMSWPRHKVKDNEGTLVDDNIVPKAVKTAVAVLANHLLSNAADPEVANTGLNISMLMVDVVTIKYDPKILPQRYPPELAYIIGRLGRCNFSPRGQKDIVKC